MLAFAPTALLLALAPPAAAAQGGIDVLGAQFFTIDTRTEPPVVEEGTTVPYRPQTSCFGWVIHVTPGEGPVTLREELRLPGPASNWGTEAGTSVHPDRAGATSTLDEDLADGMLANEWCLSEGDPTGAHTISVYAGDRLLRRFEFVVLGPPRRI